MMNRLMEIGFWLSVSFAAALANAVNDGVFNPFRYAGF